MIGGHCQPAPFFLENDLNIEFHPLADIFPLIGGAEFESLAADILANGVLEPIVIYEGQILDGRNRYRAAMSVGVDCPKEEYTGTDPAGYVVSLNIHRRHLTESQRAMSAAKLANMGAGRNWANLPDKTSNAEAAKMLNVSERSVKTAKNRLIHRLASFSYFYSSISTVKNCFIAKA